MLSDPAGACWRCSRRRRDRRAGRSPGWPSAASKTLDPLSCVQVPTVSPKMPCTKTTATSAGGCVADGPTADRWCCRRRAPAAHAEPAAGRGEQARQHDAGSPSEDTPSVLRPWCGLLGGSSDDYRGIPSKCRDQGTGTRGHGEPDAESGCSAAGRLEAGVGGDGRRRGARPPAAAGSATPRPGTRPRRQSTAAPRARRGPPRRARAPRPG